MASCIYEWTRPANTTALTAGDVIGVPDSGTPANAGSAVHELEFNGSMTNDFIITGYSFAVYAASVPSGMTSFRAEMYGSEPDAILDNAAWALTSAADFDSYRGFIDLGTPVVKGGWLYVEQHGLNKPIRAYRGGMSPQSKRNGLFTQIVTIGTWTPPANSTKFRLALYAVPVL